MVGHQTVGVTNPVVPCNDVLQDIEETEPVLVIQEDVLTSITTGGDVVHRVFIFDP